MRLNIAPAIRGKIRALVLSAVLLTSWVAILSVWAPAAHAASVSYVIDPASSKDQSSRTITVKLSVKTDVALGGGSVHLEFDNSSYTSFQSSNSPAFIFSSYHIEQNDVVFICNENACNPGTYEIGTFTFTASSSGDAQVSFVPRETGDPRRNPLTADGVTGNYNILSTAPDVPAGPKKQSTFVVPKDNGTGGTEPVQISNDAFTQQSTYAQQTGASISSNDLEAATTFWTTKNIVLAGIGAVVLLAILWLIALRFIGRRPKGPYGQGPSDPQGPPPVIYTR